MFSADSAHEGVAVVTLSCCHDRRLTAAVSIGMAEPSARSITSLVIDHRDKKARKRLVNGKVRRKRLEKEKTPQGRLFDSFA